MVQFVHTAMYMWTGKVVEKSINQEIIVNLFASLFSIVQTAGSVE